KSIRKGRSAGPRYVPPELLDVYQLAIEAGMFAGETYGETEAAKLIEQFESPWPEVSETCKIEISSLRVRSPFPALIRAKPSPNKYVSLIRLGTPEAIDHLIEVLESGDLEARKLALSSLSFAGRWAVPLLVELLDDPTLRTKGEAPIGGGGIDAKS